MEQLNAWYAGHGTIDEESAQDWLYSEFCYITRIFGE